MNRLAEENSPYLKQHKDNPVNWYPWGEEALSLAKSLDKPILVSIGYSACHWCHVMAHECFENEHLAQIMNAHFINIKIDREERPDIDAIYMDALHMMGLRGGWPLNVFLMPDGKPFYGGTYFPPQNWQNILLGINEAFENRRDELQQSADGFASDLGKKEIEKWEGFSAAFDLYEPINKEAWHAVKHQLIDNYDSIHGGLMRVPKFPMPAIWRFCLALNVESADFQHLFFSLERMVLGGIFDHIGGGWTRYSTDRLWKVPHFEKMLYDNAQLLTLYAESLKVAYEQLSAVQKAFMEDALIKTVAWLNNEMKAPVGGFYAALDADSEGVEGKYYVWDFEEVGEILGDDFADFNKQYNFSREGNWEHGQNILHLEQTFDLAYLAQWNENLKSLKIFRDKRIRPGLDDKVICSWNALCISGLVSVFKLGIAPYALSMARDAALVIRTKLMQPIGDDAKALWHILPKNKQYIFGFLDDYAATIQCFLDLYQVSFEETYIDDVVQLANYVHANFFDADEPLYYYTDFAAEKLIARKKEIYDNVIPSSNSMLAHAFYDLGKLTGQVEWVNKAKVMLNAVVNLAIKMPQDMANWLRLAHKMESTIPEVVVCGKKAKEMAREIGKKTKKPIYLLAAESESKLTLFEGRQGNLDKCTFYVCVDNACKLPQYDLNSALTQIYDT